MQIVSIILCATAGAMYHVSQKSIPVKSNSALSLIVAYAVALIGTLIWYLSSSSSDFAMDVKNIHWSSISLGCALIFLELGVLLAYRSGWAISNFNIFYTILLTSLLVPIGMILFKETLNPKVVVGMIVSIIGVIIMKI